jgi:hypothetical protein
MAGEMLLQAKQLCKHGEWLPWLKANVRISKSTAYEYMQIAEGWNNLPPGGNLGFKEALRLLSAESAPEGAGRGATRAGFFCFSYVLQRICYENSLPGRRAEDKEGVHCRLSLARPKRPPRRTSAAAIHWCWQVRRSGSSLDA